jgi:hypothetical protein
MMARAKNIKPLEQRLRERLCVTENGCWEWAGFRNAARGGYGQIGDGNGKVVMTHRAAWMVWRGPIPPGLCVLHRCDNPPCCNPAHLFLGTKADNNADMAAKGRVQRGERASHAKLTEAQVLAIRDDPRSQVVIAAEHGIDPAQISRIKSGRAWSHVTGIGH